MIRKFSMVINPVTNFVTLDANSPSLDYPFSELQLHFLLIVVAFILMFILYILLIGDSVHAQIQSLAGLSD